MDEETAFTTELIVSELVGNAVRYGALRPCNFASSSNGCSPARSATPRPALRSETCPHHRRTGRGLFIIASVAEQWGTRYQAQGKTVGSNRQGVSGAPNRCRCPA